MDLSEIIERVEKASEGSRELDIAIYGALFPAKVAPTPLPPGMAAPPPDFGTDEFSLQMHAALHYTTSLDAAMSLVPPEYQNLWRLAQGPDGAAAELGNEGFHNAATPALALLLACLKARVS